MKKLKNLLLPILLSLCIVTIGLAPMSKSNALENSTKSLSTSVNSKSSSVSKNTVMKAYRKFLSTYKGTSSLSGEQLKYFFTLDINKDGVKELITVDKSERAVKVYTYYKSKVKYCGESYNRGVVYIDKLGRLARRFNNSEEKDYYYLTLNKSKKLYIVGYTYDKLNNRYYKGTDVPDNCHMNKTSISKSTFESAVKKAERLKYVNKHLNTSTNRSKYLK